MRRSIFPIALAFAFGCGGTTDDTASSTGGGNDAGSDAPAVDAPANDAVEDASDGGPVCAPDGGFVQDMKECHGASDCLVETHAVDCCGTMKWVGVSTANATAFLACEQAWASSLPACGCAGQATTAEDGNEASDPSLVVIAECTYWTMNGGVCMTRVVPAGSDAGAPGIACGGASCTPGQEMCCVAGSAPSLQCVQTNVVGPQCDFSARCDGPEDCGAGNSCCGPSGAMMQTYCATGSCPAGQTLCHVPGDCPSSTPECCTSNEFGWPHGVCTSGTCPP